MKRIGLRLFVLCLLSATATAAAEQQAVRLPLQDQDLQRRLRTDYYGVYILGTKAGWAKESFTKQLDAKAPGYLSSMELNVKVEAAGVKSELKHAQFEEFDAKPPYAFRGGLYRESDGKSVTEVKLTRADKPQARIMPRSRKAC